MPTVLSRAAHQARVVSRAQLPALWDSAFNHLAKDQRYYEVVDDTLGDQFDCRYLVLEDPEGQPRAIQPFFVAQQDLVAATSPTLQALVQKLRRLSPGLLRLKILMVGCAAGEGHLDDEDPDEQRWIASNVAAELPRLAREHGAALIVWKDFPSKYRRALEPLRNPAQPGGAYLRVASMPATGVSLDFNGYEDYLSRHLSHATRKNLRRKYKASARRGSALEMSVVTDISAVASELHGLYAQVFARSSLHFEELTPAFFRQISARMPDRVRYFLWRLDGRLVAFSLCLVHGDTLYDEYLGLDYSVALDRHLYFVTLRDIFSWGIAQGLRTYRSTPLNYDPKLHLGFELAPLDLYVRAVSPLLQPIIRRALPLIEPTRAEPVLQRFPNAHEL